ncbi:hypothetical protein BTO30_15625, partial [Domibacillus antri]
MKLNLNVHIYHELQEDNFFLLFKIRLCQGADIVPFDASELLEFRVDKYSTVTYRQNHYSVPEGHVGKWVKLKASAETIRIFSEHECLATHRRCWQTHQWVMDIYHYVHTFKKKKGALAQSECLSQAPTQLQKIYQDQYIGNERDFQK